MADQPERDDENTPIEGIEIPLAPNPDMPADLRTIAHRTRTTATDAREAVVTLSQMRSQLDQQGWMMRQHIDRYDSEHKGITENMSLLNARVNNVQDQMLDQTQTLGRIEGQVGVMLDEIKQARKLTYVHQKTTIETEAVREQEDIKTQHQRAQSEIREAENTAKHRRRRNFKILSIGGSIIIALAGGIAALFQAC